MDYDKLIEHLRECGTYGFKQEECREAALAIEALRADLARVTAERNAAIAYIAVILAEVEEIRRGYGVDNADADSAFANLCGSYCANRGDNCYKEGEKYCCKNFKWRGVQKED